MTTSPGLSNGASAPAMPKLMMPVAPARIASSRRLVRSCASPPPTTGTVPAPRDDAGFACQAGDGDDRHHSPYATLARIAGLEIAVARQRPRAGRISDSRDSADRRRAGSRRRCNAPAATDPSAACVRFEIARCRARRRDDRPRPPPSGRAAPRPSATPSKAPARSRCSRACSCRNPRPSRRPRSGSRSASRAARRIVGSSAVKPGGVQPASADQVP